MVGLSGQIFKTQRLRAPSEQVLSGPDIFLFCVQKHGDGRDAPQGVRSGDVASPGRRRRFGVVGGRPSGRLLARFENTPPLKTT